MTKSGPRWSLGNASTGQKLGAGALALVALLVMANGDGEADATAKGLDTPDELASPIHDRGPRLTYARRPSADNDDFRAPPRRKVREFPEPNDAPRSDEDAPRLTYLPKDDSFDVPPVTPSFDEPVTPATTVQETTEATPAAPASPGRTASGAGGAPGSELARTGAAATLTAMAGVGLVYTGTSLRDRIRRARTRPYGRTVPAPGEGRPCAYEESLKLQKRPK